MRVPYEVTVPLKFPSGVIEAIVKPIVFPALVPVCSQRPLSDLGRGAKTLGEAEDVIPPFCWSDCGLVSADAAAMTEL